MEIVKLIQDVNERFHDGAYNHDYTGYMVVTNKNVYKVLIESDQQCCERWGTVITEDNPDDFIGAVLLSSYVTDESLLSHDFCDVDGEWVNAMFVTFSTSSGDFQVALYNEHNGFYGHRAQFVINGVVEEGRML